MNLILIVSALLFYTQAKETKECPKYVVTEAMVGYEQLKGECKKLNGVIASEDLLDSENGKLAKSAYANFYKEDETTEVYLGIAVRNLESGTNKVTNPFVFSDGSDFSDGDFLKWTAENPSYNSVFRCTHIANSNFEIKDAKCDQRGVALCYVACSEDENSGSERSRANLHLFALFLVAGSVFNAFHALAGIIF